MKILFDLRTLQDSSKVRGIGRYACELIVHLQKLYPELACQLFFDKNLGSAYAGIEEDFPDSEKYFVPQKPWYVLKSSTQYKRDYIAKTINQVQTDLVHFTGQFSLSSHYSQKYIVTVHDLIPFLFKKPFFYGGQVKYFYDRDLNKLKNILSKAVKIITVSNFSKNDLVKVLGLNPDQIEVVYNGIGDIFKEKISTDQIEVVLKKYNITQPYVLYTGGMEDRKNMKALLRSFSAFKQSYGRDYKLVIAGKIEHVFSTYEVKKYGLKSEVVFTDYVPDYDLVCLYGGAQIFLFLSLYEGFGMPPLEAMAQGVPVICLKNTSIPEILGEAPFYVPNSDEESVVPAMIRLGEEQNLRRAFSKIGQEQAQKYSWEETAQKTMEVYNRAMSSSNE